MRTNALWEQRKYRIHRNTKYTEILQSSISLWQVSDDYVNLTGDKTFLFLFQVFKDQTTWTVSVKQVCTVRKHSRNSDADAIQSSPSFAISEADLFPPGDSRTAQASWKTVCTGLASFNLQHPSQHCRQTEENGKARCSWYEPVKDGKRIFTCPFLIGKSEYYLYLNARGPWMQSNSFIL